jgi:hypothetical protein
LLDLASALQGRFEVGIGGSDKEKGLEAAAYAVSPPVTSSTGTNAGFVRVGAALQVIVLSDEEDCSDGGALDGQSASDCYTEIAELVPVADWVSALRSVKDLPSDVAFHAIVGLPTSTCPSVYLGSRYADAAALTGGLAFDICATDLAGPLEAIGLAATGMRSAFALAGTPDPATIVVGVDGADAEGWSYDPAARLVTFGEMPERGAVVEVTYLLPVEE